MFKCKNCSKEYTSEKRYLNHIEKCNDNVSVRSSVTSKYSVTDLDDLSRKFLKYKQKCESLEKKDVENEAKISQLETDIQQRDASVRQLTLKVNGITEIETSIKQRDAIIRELKLKLNGVAELETSIRNEIATVNSRNIELNREMEQLRLQKDAIILESRAKLEQNNENIRRLNEIIRVLNEKVKTFKEEKETDLTAKNQEIADLKSNITYMQELQLKQRSTLVKEESSKIQELVALHKEELSNMEYKCKQIIQQGQDIFNKEKIKYDALLREKDVEILKLKDEIDISVQRYDNIAKKREEDHKEYVKELKKQNIYENLAKINLVKIEHEKELHDKNNSISELDKRCRAIEKINEQLNTTINGLETEIANSKTQFLSVLNTQKDKIDEKDKRIQLLENMNAEYDRAIKARRNDIDKVLNDNKAEITRLTNELSDSNEKLTAMKEKYTSLAHSSKTLTSQIEVTTRKNKELTEVISTIEIDMNKVVQELKVAKNTSMFAEAKIASITTEFNEKIAKMEDKHKTEVENLTSEYASRITKLNETVQVLTESYHQSVSKAADEMDEACRKKIQKLENMLKEQEERSTKEITYLEDRYRLRISKMEQEHMENLKILRDKLVI